MWQHALPPRVYRVLYYVSMLIGTPTLGPVRGSRPWCMVMATVLINQIDVVAVREKRLRRYYPLIWFLFSGLAHIYITPPWVIST